MSRTYAITGVASGIGAELARKLKLEGHSVIGFDVQSSTRNVDHFIELDLNDPNAIVAAAKQTPCMLHGLCNNAGFHRHSSLYSSHATDAKTPRFDREYGFSCWPWLGGKH